MKNFFEIGVKVCDCVTLSYKCWYTTIVESQWGCDWL